MRETIVRVLCLVAVVCVAGYMVGCQCVTAEPGEPAPAPAAIDPGCPTIPPPGAITAAKAFPTGDRATSVILIEKIAPGEVSAGQEFEYQLKATNVTRQQVENVVVTEQFLENYKFQSSDPKAQMAGNTAKWALGSLGAGESKTITVKGAAQKVGQIASCAEVTYKTQLCFNVPVVEPALKLVKKAPAEVLLCDVIPLEFIVTNGGSGVARNVTVIDNLPAGLATLDGRTTLTYGPCDLAPGASRQYNETVKAAKTGKYNNKAVAKADGGLTSDASTVTVVTQPVLQIAKKARAAQFVGRPIGYEVTVGNKGDAIARNVVVTDTIPANTTFSKASDGGTFAAGRITWTIASLAPEASKTLQAQVTAAALGKAVNTVTANADCADPVNAQAATEIKGIPAILLEVIDLDDPIEVGGQTTYVITATNQGSLDATNVKIVVTLEADEDHVSNSGATTGSVAGKVLTFKPVPAIPPQQKATWRVIVKALKAGDTRFKVTMTSDQLKRPVEETESTNLY